MNLKTREKRAICLIPILLLSLIVSVLSLAPIQVSAATTYIYTTFDGDSAAEEKLWVYTSTDGSNWSLFANTGFGGPTGILRDPSIIKNPGDGKYYIAYTVQSWSATTTYFNIASSSDLRNWSHVTSVNAGISGTQYTWAPEFFIDNGTVKVIVSLSPAQPYKFKPYVYTAQNSSLTSWSGGVVMSGIGPNIIDTFVVKSGSTYHAFTQNGDTLYIEHATASSLTGPWTYIATGNWAGWGSGKEGPCLFQLDNGTWTLFADWYSTNGIYKATSSNLTSWSSPLVSVGSLSTKRHGTVWRETSVVIPTPTPGSGTGTYYKIRNVATSLYIDGMGRTASGDNAGQYGSSSSYNQQWTIETVGSYVKIRNRATGLYLDGMGRTSNGSACGQYASSGSNNQQWSRVSVGTNVKFKNRATGLCIDGMGRTANGSDLGQYADGSSTNQQWALVQQ